MDFAKEWASLLVSLSALAGTIWALFTSSAKTAHHRIDQMNRDRTTTADAIVARFQAVEGKVIKLQADFEHMPDRSQVHNIELALEKLNGEFRVLSERLEPVAAIAHRIQELEFEKASRK
jgi:hypothetical protein